MMISAPLLDRRSWWLLFAITAALFALYAPDVLAQDDGQAKYTTVLNAFQTRAQYWQTTLTASASWLFFTLAILSFLWANVTLALKGGDISELVNVNVKEILRIGFMYGLLVHGYDWSRYIINSFRAAGGTATSSGPGGVPGGIDPANIFQNGVAVAGRLLEQGSSWNVLNNVGLLICALLLIVVFAFVAAFMAVAIVESYIVIGGAVLLLGFGGSTFTADIAKRTLMYCISVGAKLFVMQLIVGVAMGAVVDWATTYQQDNSTSMLSLIGLVLLVAILAKSIPETVQGLLSGTSFAGPGAMLSTVAASAAAVTAAGAAVGAAGAAGGAAKAAGNGATATLGGSVGAGGGGGMAAMGGSMFSAAAPHMARSATALLDAGSGVNMGGALASMSGSMRPDAPSTSGEGGGGDGGTISCEPASPGEPTPGGSNQGGKAASSGAGKSQPAQQNNGSNPTSKAGQGGGAASASPPTASADAASAINADVAAGVGAAFGDGGPSAGSSADGGNGSDLGAGFGNPDGVPADATQSDGAPSGSGSGEEVGSGMGGGGVASPPSPGSGDSVTLDERSEAAGESAAQHSSGSAPAGDSVTLDERSEAAGESAAQHSSGSAPAPAPALPANQGNAGSGNAGSGGGAVSASPNAASASGGAGSLADDLLSSDAAPPMQPSDSAPATLDERAYAQDGPQLSLDNEGYATDGPLPGDSAATRSKQNILKQATRGAVVGTLVAGPVGGAVGAAAGAVVAKHGGSVGAAVKSIAARARARFGLDSPSEKPTDSGPLS